MAEILSELASREGQSEIAEKIESGINRFGDNFGSLTNALRAESAAGDASLSADHAAESEAHAKTSEINAHTSEVNAKTSETNAATILRGVQNEYGYPFTAATAAAMTDPEKIYVYTGSEAGYVHGNWYYHNGTAFVSGGVYNSTAFETDDTLSVPGMAADAGVVGEKYGNQQIFFMKKSKEKFIRINAPGAAGDVFFVQLVKWGSIKNASFIIADSHSDIVGYVNGVGDSIFITLRQDTNYITILSDIDIEITENIELSVIFVKVSSERDLVNLLFNNVYNLRNKSIIKTAFANGTDFDAIKTKTLYGRVIKGFTYDNLPVSAPGCIFIYHMPDYYDKDYFTLQLFYSMSENRWYTRTYNGTDWSDWKASVKDSDFAEMHKFPFNMTTITESTKNRITTINVSAQAGQKVFICPKVYKASVSAGVIIRAYIDESTYLTLGEVQLGGIYMGRLPVDVVKFTVGFVSDSLTSETERTILFAVYDEASISERSPLQGKYISILGASMSTFEGYIPEGGSVYYPHETSNPYPVMDVHDTYWMKTIDALGLKLLINNSSAGSFCTTGHGSDEKAGCGTRCESLDDGIHVPDIIVIQLGANDFTRNVAIGTYDGTVDAFPSDTTTFREAYATMLKKITEKYKMATVYCGTLPMCSGGSYISQTFPPKNTDGTLLEEYNKAIREIASLFGTKVWEINRCGITFQNIHKYMQDYISSNNYGQHPNKHGQSLFANELIKTLDPSCKALFTTM